MNDKDHFSDIEEYLNLVCKNCKKANGYCIKDEPYIGLCAKLDKEELIELLKEKEKKKGEVLLLREKEC